MTSNIHNFGANDNPSATGATGSSNSNDPVTGSYGNTHSSTGRTNPIHPSNPQSTAHPAYGNSTFSSPYETGGGNTGQGDGEGPGVGQGSSSGGQEGAGVGQSLHQGGHGGLGKDYHENVNAAYGHATGPEPPEGYATLGNKKKGPYDTAGGNAAQAGGEGSTRIGGPATLPETSTTQSSANTAEATPDTGYRAQPYTSGNAAANTTYTTANNTTSMASGTGTVDNRSTGAKVKEMAHGVKGLVAAVHGAGESLRGQFNAGVDHTFDQTGAEEKNRILAAEGKQEMETGMFSEGTKEREGVVPGSKRL